MEDYTIVIKAVLKSVYFIAVNLLCVFVLLFETAVFSLYMILGVLSGQDYPEWINWWMNNVALIVGRYLIDVLRKITK